MLKTLLMAVVTVLSIGGTGVAQMPALRAVGCPDMTVTSLERSIPFYTQTLAFTLQSTEERSGDSFEHQVGVFGAHVRIAHLTLGDECLDLTEYLTPQGRPIPPGAASNDLGFQHSAIVVSDMTKAFAILRERHVRYVSTSPQTLPATIPAVAGVAAFYFKDEDGHPLELISFPPDKGQPKWHSGRPGVFLGIDHTAMVISEMEPSVAFYRDVLGMKILATSDNFGTEQEHLAGVFGAHVRVTSLRGPAGPGIELLQYLSPESKRALPDVRANDVLHWQTPLVVNDLEQTRMGLARLRMDVVSSTVTDSPGGRAFLVKDPDGHELKLFQK